MSMDNEKTNLSADLLHTASTGKQLPQARVRARHKKHIGMWLARALLVLSFCAGFYLSAFPSGRATVRAFTLLPGLLTASQPSWQAPVAEPVQHTQTTISSSAGNVYLDTYAPVEAVPPVPGAREGVLVIPGVGDQRKDKQLINFSETLAHAGIVVMDMTTPTLVDSRLSAGDEAAVIQAFHALQHWPGVRASRVGLLGFSAGGPFMCLAAADARMRDRVAFVALFGGYFDATTFLKDIGRRALEVDGHAQNWQPVAYPLQVFANTIALLLPGNDGQELVSAFAPGGSGSLPPAQVAQVAPGSAAAYHLLAGDEPERVDANVAALPPAIKALLVSLSPARVVDQIRAPIYLLHDRSDQFVPFSESRAFAAALSRIHHPYDFAEFGIFQHVEVRTGLGLPQLLGDGQNLLRIVSKVVQIGS